MNIEKIFAITSTLDKCGMNLGVISPIDDNKMLIAAIDEDGMIAVYHKTNNSSTVDATMGIGKIDTFVKKMKLLDLSKTRVAEELTQLTDIRFSKSIVMKEGRKKVMHSFSNPQKLSVPISVHPSFVTVIVELDNDQTDKLRKAINTFNPETIGIKADGKELSLSFVDNNGDKYTDVIGETDSNWSYDWKKEKFVKLLANVTVKDTGASFGITDAGLMYFVVNDLNVMLAPILL